MNIYVTEANKGFFFVCFGDDVELKSVITLTKNELEKLKNKIENAISKVD